MSARSLAKASQSVSYTAEQIQLIKNTVAVGATDDELKLFMQVCKNHKLDPFTRQIHFVKRKAKNQDGTWGERGAFQISIDGFRTIAERTGAYAGNDDPVFDSEVKPSKATVTVWKIVNGTRCPFTATARWKEYVPLNKDGMVSSPMWKKMPMLMMSKCAEALALRKAFPEALSGLYSDDEMEQAGEEKPVRAQVVDATQINSDDVPDSAKAKLPEEAEYHAKIESAVAAEGSDALATADQVREIAALCKELGGTVHKLYAKYKVADVPSRKLAADMLDALRKRTGRVSEAELIAAEEKAKTA